MTLKSIFIISGEKGSGKTTFLIDVLALLQTNGFEVRGFVALHELESDSYQIKNIKTNEISPLMQRIATFSQRPNHFKFFSEGLEVGNNSIKESLSQPTDIVSVDEIGGYELKGELWSSGFTKLVESAVPLIFTTKAKHLEGVVEKWRLKPSFIFHSDDFENPQKAFERIKRFF